MKRFIILIALVIVVGLGVIVAFGYFNKDSINVKKFFDKQTYKEYHAGDMVSFHNENWYIMYDSSKEDDYVTMISSDILFLEDQDLGLVVDGIFETSDLNKYLKNDYVRSLGENKLVEIHGYKARLFNEDDFNQLLDVKYNENDDSYKIENCPDYICLTNTFYATMIDTNSNVEFKNVYLNLRDIDDLLYDDYTLHLKYYNIASTYETYQMKSLVEDPSLFVRPVVNVYKEYIED